MFVALSGHIAATLIEGQLHDELAALAEGCNVPLRVQDLNIIALFDVVCSDLTGADCFNTHCLRTIGVQLCSDTLQVQDNLSAFVTTSLNFSSENGLTR